MAQDGVQRKERAVEKGERASYRLSCEPDVRQQRYANYGQSQCKLVAFAGHAESSQGNRS